MSSGELSDHFMYVMKQPFFISHTEKNGWLMRLVSAEQVTHTLKPNLQQLTCSSQAHTAVELLYSDADLYCYLKRRATALQPPFLFRS